MECRVVEEEPWKCPKHPSKSRRTGVCPTCLRDRLGSLCPVCATVRPCGCVSNSNSSSSSSASASSSFSFFNNGGDASNLSETEPSFRRSRSIAVTFLRSASRRISTQSFLGRAATKERYDFDDNDEDTDSNTRINDLARVVTRSRSVSTAAVAPVVHRSDLSSSPAKWKLWHFSSPMSFFRRSKEVMVQGRSPRHRG